MPYTGFHEQFPEIAENETRMILVMEELDGVPLGQFSLTEAYCDEKDCDCRRVMFNICRLQTQEIVAVVAYGWETATFYRKWFGDNDKEIIRDLQGPILNQMSGQASYAETLLERIKGVLKDKAYIERIKKHYEMFRNKIQEEHKANKLVSHTSIKIGRNKPCPCGSGKKYKKCCEGNQ